MTDYIKTHPLNAKDTAGIIGKPEFAGATTIISTKSADLKNSTTDLNGSYDHTDRAAKFSYPTVSQSVPTKGNNQYE